MKQNEFGLSVAIATPGARGESSATTARSEEFIVTKVEPDGPAKAAGLETGDLILGFRTDKHLETATSVKDFQNYMNKNDEIAVSVRDATHPPDLRTLTKAKK